MEPVNDVDDEKSVSELPAPPRKKNPKAYCVLCGERRLPGWWCCEGIMPKVPAECLWCGEDLHKGRAFCNSHCRTAYGQDLSLEVLDRPKGVPRATLR